MSATNLRCKECNKKISFMNAITSTCRCKEIFCNLHRIDHKCSFDYKEDYKNNNKMIKITRGDIECLY